MSRSFLKPPESNPKTSSNSGNRSSHQEAGSFMRHRALLAVTAATLAGFTSMVGTTTAGAVRSPSGQLHSAKVCGAPAAGYAACLSVVRTDAAGKPLVTANPSGLGPADIKS